MGKTRRRREFFDFATTEIDPLAVGRIPPALSRRHQALAVAMDGDTLIVAMADPSDVIAIDDISAMTRMDVRALEADPQALADAIARDAASVSGEMVLDDVDAVDEAVEKVDVSDAPVVRLVNDLVTRAVAQRASDIHLEPHSDCLRVRYRIDGVLHEVSRIPKSHQAAVISRIKVMTEMNIAERRIPQDGRVTLTVDGRHIDIRGASLPSVWGENVVLRLLDRAGSVIGLEELGFAHDAQKRYEESFRRAYGTILVTGPTGSGKSTTLYATLALLNDPSVNIVTVEDPVEFRMSGITQMPVNVKAGLSFATALRSILRADPDVVMIGEIRDRETAAIATEAALTGHMVLSTLHTNDAASAVTRLLDMGIEPFLVSSSLDCVVAQRLARKLCDRCREPVKLNAKASAEAGLGDKVQTIYQAVGCAACAHTGYRGRVALFEVMVVDESMSGLIAARSAADVIRRHAISRGMETLRQDGLNKVSKGITSLQEVLRVVV